MVLTISESVEGGSNLYYRPDVSSVQMELWFLLGHLSVYSSLPLPFLENLYLSWKENVTEDLTELLTLFLLIVVC